MNYALVAVGLLLVSTLGLRLARPVLKTLELHVLLCWQSQSQSLSCFLRYPHFSFFLYIII